MFLFFFFFIIEYHSLHLEKLLTDSHFFFDIFNQEGLLMISYHLQILLKARVNGSENKRRNHFYLLLCLPVKRFLALSEVNLPHSPAWWLSTNTDLHLHHTDIKVYWFFFIFTNSSFFFFFWVIKVRSKKVFSCSSLSESTVHFQECIEMNCTLVLL